MKNKKGFTLIELLAVIVLISTILTIVVINVAKYSGNRKEKDWENTKQIIEETAKTFVETDPEVSTNVDNTIKIDKPVKVDYSILVGKGLISSDTKNPVTNRVIGKNSYIKITLNSDYSYSYHFQLVDSDNPKPQEDQNIIGVYKLCKPATSEQLHDDPNGGKFGKVKSGDFKKGDALICDVNGDGKYEDKTEMFYYISDYYDTSTKSYNTNYAALIYYNNVAHGEPNNIDSIAYYASNENWHGPTRAKDYLPTTEQWTNVGLYKTSRAILSISSDFSDYSAYSSSTSGGTLPTDFSYSGYSARLLTTAEIKGCSSSASTSTGTLDNCTFLLENTSYASGGYSSWYWLENPNNGSEKYIWAVYGSTRRIFYVTAITNTLGVRPVIDVEKSNIE